MKNIFKLFILILMQCFVAQNINAQASLSIQGILKKSNGVAVDDGLYTITFRLYDQETGSVSNAIWSETQSDVEVFSGIYSAVLGKSESYPLNVPFDEPYYLGVTIGSTEMTPRILLTSAPYALSLRGETNQFPSSGKVLADSILVDGGVHASGGTPGLNGANRNGYAFSGENGDKDSGLFSTGDGKASLFSNNTEVLAVTPGAVTVNGNLTNTGTFTSGNVNLSTGGTVDYNGLSDWRLVDLDNFSGGSTDEWLKYGPTTGEWIGWKNSSGNAPISTNFGVFKGYGITPSTANDVLKKQFTISGTFTHVKVKFKYHFLDSWEFGAADLAFAAFASTVTGNDLRVGWIANGPSLNYNGKSQTTPFLEATTYYGSSTVGAIWIDHSLDIEMIGEANGNSFWLFVGAMSDLNDAWPEIYGLGNVEIWVR